MEEMAIVSHALLSGMRLGLRMVEGTKADWERSRTTPELSPFAPLSFKGGKRPFGAGSEHRDSYDKRSRSTDWRSTSTAAGGASTSALPEADNCEKCNRRHGSIPCAFDAHPDSNRNPGVLWKDCAAARAGLNARPPIHALHHTYAMSGAVLPEGTRQRLSDARNKAQGRETKKVRPQAEVFAWGSTPGPRGRNSAPAPTDRAPRTQQGELLRVVGKKRHTPTRSSPPQASFDELCECVQACGFEQLTAYTNRCSVSLSAYVQTVPVGDHTQVLKETTTAQAATTTSANRRVDIDTVARLDTGANCNDYISRELANKLIAMGSPVIPIAGRVCGAFEREGRVMTSRVKCNYKYVNVQTLQQEKIVIEPVILDDLIAPLIVGLQTVGQYDLLMKQLPTLCRNTMDAKLPLTCSPSNGALRGAKRAIGGTPAHADVCKDHRCRALGPIYYYVPTYY